jgi:hypothetical protein
MVTSPLECIPAAFGHTNDVAARPFAIVQMTTFLSFVFDGFPARQAGMERSN